VVNNQRRKILKLTGTALAAGLAGCSSDNEKDKKSNSGTDTTTENSYETEVTFSNLDSLNILPFVNEENIDNKAGLRLEVEDQDGLERIQLTYNDQHRDQPHTIYDRAKNEFENGAGNQMIPISQEFPQRIIAPETGEFTVKATDTNGNTETRTEQINLNPNGWKVDRENGQYQTKRNWDNHQFNRQQLQENHISGWDETATYNKVLEELEKLEQGEDVLVDGGREKYIGEHAQALYSNSEYEKGNAEGYGEWDGEFYSELTDLEHILGDAQNTVLTHQRVVHPTAFSAWNNRAAATLENIIHEFNNEAKQHLEQTGEKAVYASGVAEGGHGTIITYTDTENTDIEAEHPWQFVDTTSDGIAPVTEEINTGGEYNPFVEGYESETQTEMTYEGEKRIAQGALEGFIAKRDNPEPFQWQHIGISDNILEDLFNKHVPQKGSIDPIMDMMEEAIDLQIDTEGYVQVYGDSLDNYEMAVTRDEGLYEQNMDQDTTVTEQTVENYLTQTA
jgi:hypothetical protein